MLDRQDPAHTARDRQTIVTALSGTHSLEYGHRPSHEEPLLWAVDGLVWACGAGGDWRRRVDTLVDISGALALTWNTRLPTVRRARRVHFPPLRG